MRAPRGAPAIFAWFLVVAFLVILVLEGLGRVVVSESFLSKRLMKSGKIRAATMESASASLLGGSLEASNVEILLADSTRITVDSMHLRGSWLRALGGRNPRVERAVLAGVSAEGERYLTHVDEVRLGSGTSRITNLTFGPHDQTSSILRPGKPTSYQGHIDTMHIEEFDLDELYDRQELRIGTITLLSPAIRIYSDRRLAGARRPKRLPHEAFRSLALPVRVETVHLREGTIRYEEVPRDGVTPGVVEFGAIRADLGPIDNRRPDTLVVRSWTRINEALPLAVELEWPIHLSRFDLEARAWTSAFSATALNSMFEPNAGIRILSGRIDTLETQFRVVDGRATGTLDALYHDLEFESVNKKDPSDKNTMKSWILDMKMRENRDPDAPEQIGEIQHQRAETESIFKFLWLTVRSGLISLVSR